MLLYEMSSTFQRVGAEQQMLSVPYGSVSLLLQCAPCLPAGLTAQPAALASKPETRVFSMLVQEAPNSRCTDTISQELPRFSFI